MPMTKPLRQRIADGETLVALRGSLTTTRDDLAELWSTGRYDYIWIDSQHTPYSDERLVAYCAAAEELGIDVQLRVPHTRAAHLVGRYLDLGASAVLVPEVEESATVDDAIAFAYYPPVGRRSWGGLERRGFAPGWAIGASYLLTSWARPHCSWHLGSHRALLLSPARPYLQGSAVASGTSSSRHCART